MPRDSDKNNDPRGRRDRPGGGQGRAGGGKGRSGAARGPDKKFAKRGFGDKKFAGKGDGEKRPYRGDREDRPPRREFGDKPRFNRDDARGDRPFRDRPARDGDGEKRTFKARGDRPRFDRGGDGEKRSFKPREDRGGEKRPFTPRGDRPNFNRDDRPPRRDRDDARPAGRSSIGSSATGSLTRRASVTARSGPIRRVASDRSRPSFARWRPARTEIRRRQQVQARCGGSRPAQGFWRPAAARRIQAVAEARGRLRSSGAWFASVPRRPAQFRQAARRSRRRRAAAVLALPRRPRAGRSSRAAEVQPAALGS